MIQFIGGNQITLLKSGNEYFPALLAAIENAHAEIYIQSYIYEMDSIGIRLGTALKEAAKRGVVVNVLLDGFGSQHLSASYVKELASAGVQLMFYRLKISPWSFKKTRLRRLHRKVVVVDGKIGFVGGINIIDDNNVPNQAPPRLDYAVRIEGRLLPDIVASTHKLWRRIAWMQIRNQFNATNISSNAIFSEVKANVKAALVLRDNILHRRDIEDAYLSAINSATSEIIIANAYFVPGRKFRKALISAADRGVDVKLLLQGRKEYILMFATKTFYTELLSKGIEIYEYRKSFMHSKVAVIDQHWATVGSSNIDPFSLLLSREANIVVMNSAFAIELRTDIIASIQDGAYRISAQKWIRGNIMQRFSSWLAYGVVRVFLGLIGYSNEQ
jgi:cardiolipin synthase